MKQDYQNRLAYDDGNYAKKLEESVGPLKYVLNPQVYERCTQVRPSQPGLIGRQGVSVSYQHHMADIESELKGLNRRASKDPSTLYKPECPKGTNKSYNGYPCGGGVAAGFESSQEKLHHYEKMKDFTEYSRNLNPPSTLRGTGLNRFDIVLYNPQDETRWFQQAPIGINQRLVVKDNHVPLIPKLIDQTVALPNSKLVCNKPKPESYKSSKLDPLHKKYYEKSGNWIPNNLY